MELDSRLWSLAAGGIILMDYRGDEGKRVKWRGKISTLRRVCVCASVKNEIIEGEKHLQLAKHSRMCPQVPKIHRPLFHVL